MRKKTPCLFMCVKNYDLESGVLELDRVLVFDEFYATEAFTYTTEYQGQKKRRKKRKYNHTPRAEFNSLDEALQFIENTYVHLAKAVSDLEWEFNGKTSFINHMRLKSLVSFAKFKNIEFVNDTRRFQIDAICEGRHIQVKGVKIFKHRTINGILDKAYQKDKVDAFVLVYLQCTKGLEHVWEFDRDEIPKVHLDGFYGEKYFSPELWFEGCGCQKSNKYDTEHKWTEDFYLGAQPIPEEV